MQKMQASKEKDVMNNKNTDQKINADIFGKFRLYNNSFEASIH